jgi:hypothetical protein
MPRNGIVVRVFFVASRRSYPPLRLVMPAKPSTFLEGAPDTAEYRIHGRLAQCNVEVWVDIRRRHPTKSQRHHAQAVVGSIRISPFRGSARVGEIVEAPQVSGIVGRTSVPPTGPYTA